MTEKSQPPAAESAREPQFHVEDSDVWIGKIRTKRGERAEITTASGRISVDALILESISWQRSRVELAAQLDAGELVRADGTPLTGGERIETSPTFRITNEYAQVELLHRRTETGEVLTVRTPARGTETNLGVSSLRALAEQDDTFAFSKFFETPVGPEDTPVEGPH